MSIKNLTTSGDWPKWAHGGTIWVLEDDQKEREMAVRAMELSGFTVRAFSGMNDFRKAIESDDAPNGVIADIRLDDGDFFGYFDDYSWCNS